MSAESRAMYFTAKNETLEGTSLSIFFAPESDRFVVAKEVLRAKSLGGVASQSLWKLMTGELLVQADTIPTIEPTSVGQVQRDLDEFLRTQPADELFLDDNAPDEIRNALRSVQETLTLEAQTRLANMFGLIAPTDFQDDRPLPGQYL